MSKWIDVNKRTPTQEEVYRSSYRGGHGRFLVATNDGFVGEMPCDICYDDKGEAFLWIVPYWWEGGVGVTHWQHLPQLPYPLRYRIKRWFMRTFWRLR